MIRKAYYFLGRYLFNIYVFSYINLKGKKMMKMKRYKKMMLLFRENKNFFDTGLLHSSSNVATFLEALNLNVFIVIVIYEVHFRLELINNENSLAL